MGKKGTDPGADPGISERGISVQIQKCIAVYAGNQGFLKRNCFFGADRRGTASQADYGVRLSVSDGGRAGSAFFLPGVQKRMQGETFRAA